MTIWMDMTNSLDTYYGGVTGITRVELMFAKMLHELNKDIKFSILTKYGFAEVDSSEINWLWKSKNIADDYKKYQTKKRKIHKNYIFKLKRCIAKLKYKQERHKQPKYLRNTYPANPYKDGDTIFSCGWLNPEKEQRFKSLKMFFPNIKLVYTIYDLAMLQDSLKHHYAAVNESFENYLKWISENCAAIMYYGETALKDTEKYFADLNYNIPKGYYYRCCNEVKINDVAPENDKTVLERLNIKSPFVLAVGSFDYKKNYKVLYQAYCMLCQKKAENIPDLVIVGRRFEGCLDELYEAFKTNPLIKDKVKILNSTDEELNVLYRNCAFTLLPSLYEGYSIVLTEYFAYNKFTLCSDVAPLREVAENYAEFINPNHPRDWAERIEYYIAHPEEIKKAEENIKQNWKPVTWPELTKTVNNYLNEVAAKDFSSKYKSVTRKYTDTINDKNAEPRIYYDYTYIEIPQLSGIPRAQIIIGRELYKLKKNITFYSIKDGEYYEISENSIKNTLSDKNIDESVKRDIPHIKYKHRRVMPFKKNDIVISLGMVANDKFRQAYKKVGFKYISTIYDMTPIIVPHTHNINTLSSFKPYLEQAYDISSFILYGGKNAKNDCDKYQKELGLTPIDSCALKWGSDIVTKEVTPGRKEKVFEKYNIKDNFILSVGTLQPRKNYELLYEAWLEMLNTKSEGEEIPQLVICGNQGWKMDKFIETLKNDERISDLIMWITPTDDELDVLYQTCKFTVLPSIYEGWSLTLPESLNYGKFCLASDTPSLKEIGEDIIDYANSYDPVEWAEKIRFYYNNQNALLEREEMIKEKWSNPTWTECAKEINDVIDKVMQKDEVIL